MFFNALHGQIWVHNAISGPKNIIVYGQIEVKKGISGPKSQQNFCSVKRCPFLENV